MASSSTRLCSSLVIRFDGVLNQLLLTAHETQERFLDSAFAFRRPCDYEFNGPGRLDQGAVREIGEPAMLQAWGNRLPSFARLHQRENAGENVGCLGNSG